MTRLYFCCLLLTFMQVRGAPPPLDPHRVRGTRDPDGQHAEYGMAGMCTTRTAVDAPQAGRSA